MCETHVKMAWHKHMNIKITDERNKSYSVMLKVLVQQID